MNLYPFSVYTRKGSKYYYVKFKKDNGEYSTGISTGQTNKQDAITTAYEWFYKGKPTKTGIISLVFKQKLQENIKKEEVIYILEELKKKGLIKHYFMEESKAAIDFIEYLTEFWDHDKSQYINEKLRKEHGIHRKYTSGMKAKISLYWKPFFQGKILGDITRNDIESFVDHISQKDISASTKNYIIRAGLIGLKYAYNKEYIEKDITTGIIMFSETHEERQILTPEIVSKVFKKEWEDKRVWLANLLALITGMRAGEIQGLQVQDIGNDYINVRHSWSNIDKLKAPKNKEGRIIEIPFPNIIIELLALAKSNPHGYKPDSFIFWNKNDEKEPMRQELFVNGLRDRLINIGLSRSKASTYTFHAWRHLYASYMKDKIEDKLLQSQTGHKTKEMLEMYADHQLQGDREKIQEVQKEIFGEIVQLAIENKN